MATRSQAAPGRRSGRDIGGRPENDRRNRWPVPALAVTVVLFLGVAWGRGDLGYGVWWMTNTAPPSISLDGPADTLRGTVAVTVQLAPDGRSQVVDAQVDGRPIAAGPVLTVDTTTLPDGPHQLVVTAEDRSWRRNRASTARELRSDNTPPRLSVDVRPGAVAQGHTWLLRVATDEPSAVEASVADRPVTLQEGSGFGWAIVGIGADTPPASAPLVVGAVDRVGNRAEQRSAVQVVPTTFTQDRVDVSPNLAPLLRPEVRAVEDARLAPIYAAVTQPRLWDGPFALPVQGQIVTEFGEVRSYNGGPFERHHGGTDFAAPAGRAVLAPARGKVVLVDRVQLRGTIVILDHGLGVFTTYAHLSAVDVQVGQEVQRGQAFAKVGSTGLSEGPHLHWELWVGGVNVDPMEWTQQSFP